MTRNREDILAALLEAGEPLSVAEVCDRMGGGIDQVTAYRSLHFLEEGGYAESFVLHCAAHGTKRYYAATLSSDGKPAGHRNWFHCERCHGFTDLGACKVDRLVRAYERENGIEIREHTLFLSGVCAKCR